MDDDFVYLYIDSSQKLKIYILDNLESQFRTLGSFRKLNFDLLSSFHGGKQGMNKFTDRERLEYVKEYKASGLSVKEFSESRGISRTTMRDWINAFESITGGFIKVDAQLKGEGDIAKNGDYRMNMLSQEQITGKYSHFTRFDHSIVVIEFNGLKITTSLEHARVILGDYYEKNRGEC